MSRKREPIFSGPLLEPIRALNRMISEERIMKFVREQRAAKLRLLAQHYGIENLDEGSPAAALALRLAEDFVPGFAVIESPPKKAGRRRGTGEIDSLALYEWIEKVRKQCTEQGIPFNITKLCKGLVGSRGHPTFRGLKASPPFSREIGASGL